MTITFPTTLDSLPKPTSTTTENQAGFEHDVVHTDVASAIEALEAKVGVTSSAVTTSHDYKLSGVTGSALAVSSTDARLTDARSLLQLAKSNQQSSVTGTLLETTLATISVPANTLAANDTLVVVIWLSMTGSTNNKTPRVKLGGTNFYSRAEAGATTVFQARTTKIKARTTSSQMTTFSGSVGTDGNLTSAMTTGTVDLTTTLSLLLTGQLALDTETLSVEAYEVYVVK